MDGVQRNFSMMAEKIDRMRCLRERCDNYVRLIKLTLDETIQEQNSLLDGSAIHNRLKYLGLIDKPYTSLSSSNKFNIDKPYLKNIDSDYKYKYLVFDDLPGKRQNKNITNFNANNTDFSNQYDVYNSNYKRIVPDYSSTIYDDSPYYMPISSKKYGKTMNIRTPDPREYEVYYFPTYKPIPQYPRHTTERFYRRKPVKQYPVEEVPYWPTRYPKPVRVVERESSYPIFDYDYHRTNDYSVGSTNIEPFTHRHRTRYLPTNDIYHNYDDNNYYYESYLEQRPYSSITRPCSPVYSRDPLYNKIHFENPGSLLEKKIRDYVWNPNKDRMETNMIPSYEKSTYYSDFKPLLNKNRVNETFRTRASISFDSQEQIRKSDEAKENLYRRNSIMIPQESNTTNDEYFQPIRDDENFSESTSYKKKPEIPVHFPKRISFDLGNEHIETPNNKISIGENLNENSITKERKSVLGRRESITKNDNKRRTSLLSNDDYSVNKLRVSSNSNSRRGSLCKQEKLSSIGNSFESDKSLNLKNKPQGDDSNSLEKNVRTYNNDFKGVDNDRNNNGQISPKTKDNKNNNILKEDIPSGNAYNKLKRDSTDSDKAKLMRTIEIPNKREKRNSIERRGSYVNEQKFKTNENISDNKIKSNNIDSQIEKEYKNYPSSVNETSNNAISQLVADQSNVINNVNKYNINQQNTDHHVQQFTNENNDIENKNNFENMKSYPVINNLNEDDIHGVGQNSSDFRKITKEPESSQDILIDKVKNNTDYYQDHFSDDIHDTLTHEYESQPEHVAGDENYYVETDKTILNNDIEPVQQNVIIDENNVHDDYYYQNPADDMEESPIENKYENLKNTQENENDQQHPNDDYYYQDYSNADSKEQPENQYSEHGQQEEYAGEHSQHDDYYYQNNASDTVKEPQGDQQYVEPLEPEYQGNYGDHQPTHDEYYYQNYDEKGQPENQYTESNNPGDYVTEHDDYYNQNHPNENTDGNQPEQHYTEPGNYANGEQSNYYYEDNSNVPQSDNYDEHAQQDNYVDNQHINDNYYYENHGENYNESIPKEQYHNYADQHDSNDSYYPDSQANNYDTQQNYENNSYQTQPSEYIEPYDQNINNENYDYSDNVHESNPIDQSSNELSK